MYASVGRAEPGLSLGLHRPGVDQVQVIGQRRLYPLYGLRVDELHERLVAVRHDGHLERVGLVGHAPEVAHPVPGGDENGRGAELFLELWVKPADQPVGLRQRALVRGLPVVHLTAATQVNVGVERGQRRVVQREQLVRE